PAPTAQPCRGSAKEISSGSKTPRAFQVWPPSSVAMMPSVPPAQPCWRSTKSTALYSVSAAGLGLTCWVTQVAPPSDVARTMSTVPTTHPCRASTKSTPLSPYVVWLSWFTQVAPPSLVARICPPVPTTQPWRASTNDMARSACGSTPLAAQVLPPSLVAQTRPLLSTTHP